MKKFTIGYSPCPNDTFIFYALAERKIEIPFELDVLLADVEMLNRRAGQGALDISKISVNAALSIMDKYWLLRSGGAMGRGCGPVIVARRPARLRDLREATIATPGDLTTASLLLRLEGTHRGRRAPMQFDRIIPAVLAGEVDAGVIIHEGRWTYQAYGLHMVLDLGRWWEEQTGLVLPLGAIAIRRDLGGEIAGVVEEKIRESLLYARKHPDLPWPYMVRHAQEMTPEVIRLHIDTFVNEFSINAGPEGEKALRSLLEAACAMEKRPFPALELFWS
ncbi:1,4-dihydroxy-6-naphtoate synthase [Syntrophobacter sp. SbD1]|nr:1,4-dihydroxy-6-naphtoate synthase [Syntrophobacter sp. SbD1]